MADRAWPHTPSSGFARLTLVGGPFDGQEVAFLPHDLSAPAQIVWGGWFPWGFAAYLYEWLGETVKRNGITDSLVYYCTGRHLTAAEIPPLVAEDAEVWADGAAMIADVRGVPPQLIWPGV